VNALPGVKAAGTIQFLPLSGMTCGTGVWLEGDVPGDPNHARSTNCSLVSQQFFAAMGIPLLQGRGFEACDDADRPRVVVVNRAFARQYFPEDRTIGRRVLVAGPNQTWAEIVGVAADIHHEGLTSAPAPSVFLLHAQAPGYITSLVVRTTAAPNVDASSIRRAIQEVDPTQAVSAVKSMEQYLDEAVARPRLYAALVTSFAVLAVTLAVIGVYGLLAYIVRQRTHEIGIRMALGAARENIFRVVLRQGVILVLSGLVIGLVATVGLRGLVSALLFGVTAGDPLAYAGAAALLMGAACTAAAVPARRAARVDPVVALRDEYAARRAGALLGAESHERIHFRRTARRDPRREACYRAQHRGAQQVAVGACGSHTEQQPPCQTCRHERDGDADHNPEQDRYERVA
jgi:putative ABC transport system permease protein